MMKIISTLFVSLFIASQSYAVTKSDFKFEITTKAPTKITLCQSQLFIYSSKERALISYHPVTGKKNKFSQTLNKDQQLTSLNCYKNKLVLGIWNTELKTPSLKLGKQKITLPENRIVRQVQCLSSKCYLLQDKLYQSSDFKQWTKKDFPKSGSIKPTKKELERNPFSDWQRALNIYEGRFLDLQIKNNKIWMLDGFQVKLVNQDISTDDVKKWGKWGVWDANMQFPKAFTFYKDDILITDTGLKSIFRFDQNGKNKGVFGHHLENRRFRYPIDITTGHEFIYIADFLANKVYALTLKSSENLTKKAGFREHHFQHPDVLRDWTKSRCLNCHDGSEAVHFNKTAMTKFHHPVQIKWNKETTNKDKATLLHKEFVDCSSCHDNHHIGAAGNFPDLNGDMKIHTKLPHMFRKGYQETCTNCHTDKVHTENNHLGLAIGKKHQVVSCNQCHQMHEAENSLLRLPTNNLCLNCHKNNKPTSHAFGSKHNVSCISCHTMHSSKQSISFARHGRADESQTCLSCHKNKVQLLGKNDHMKIISKKKIHWPKNEQSCLTCHSPHNKQTTAKAKCISCHADRKTHHHKRDISISQTKRAKGVTLDHDNKLSCITCHDPHIAGFKNQYLRPKQPVIKMCMSCHDKKNDHELYDNFHKIFKNKSGAK